MTDKQIDTALKFAEHGAYLFPVKKSKVPEFSGWKEKATTDKAQIEKWSKEYPDSNFAVKCGSESNICVLDVDVKHGQPGQASHDKLIKDIGPFHTKKQHTPSGGFHYFFLYPEEEPIGNKIGLTSYPGLDFKGQNGFVLLPGSVVEDGKKYYIIDDFALEKVPEGLLKILHTDEVVTGKARGKEITEGSRNDTLFKIGCKLRSKDLTLFEILAILRDKNKTFCRPPLPDIDVKTIAGSAYKIEPKKASMTKTLIPCLVNLVQDDNEVKYLLKNEEGQLYTTDSVVWEGQVCKPKQQLTFNILEPDILKAPMSVNKEKLLKDVMAFIRSYVEMPREEDYLILSLWIIHTYFMSSFETTPFLYFFGEPVSGKSRAGDTIMSLSYFGERLTSPTEAVIFRSAEAFHSSLLIDEIQFYGESGNPFVEVMLKCRYKRGLYAVRCNDHKAGEDGLERYDVFGPCIIATTEKLEEAITSRSLMFLMQQNISRAVEGHIDRKRAGKLRNRLTILKALNMDQTITLPDKWVARRRLGELTEPLYAILKFMVQDETVFLDYVSLLERDEQEYNRYSFPAEIVQYLINRYESRGELSIEVTTLTEGLNHDRVRADYYKVMKVSMNTERMGFKKVPLPPHRHSGFVYDYEKLKQIGKKYNIECKEFIESDEDDEDDEGHKRKYYA
jgi:hypothetical protein